MSTLVIVESPTKAKTIGRFLPEGYRVEACMGHVRDLPGSAAEIPEKYKGIGWARDYGINVDNDFEPLYIVPAEKKKRVAELKKALEDATALVIATDEDREGESIGWHLTQVLKPKVPVRRMVFHEITKTAILDALKNERDIDENLVRAQETRRILDRLVGYAVSPILWVKIAPKLSAGRVQSVAVRLLVERERERRAFKTGSYWELEAKLEKGKSPFVATLWKIDQKRVATSRDFDETTGQLKAGADLVLLNEQAAKAAVARLKGEKWLVGEVERKPRALRPYPPFTTSTLQQEANRKLGLSSGDTMRTAQRLYEQGFITYMRTDSVHLSGEAIGAARKKVTALYGADFLFKTPRQFTTASKGAQEAHEAIRPAGDTMQTPEQTGLSGRERSLYDLIWKRTMATQMADAQQELMTVNVNCDGTIFRASGKRILFPGFLRAYVEGSDDPQAALDDREDPLPDLQTGDVLALKDLLARGKETRPPGRYTEASLVEKLEKEGVGRPSTYATIIDTILARDYARKVSNALVPTFTAHGVTQLMERAFDQFVDVGFTSSMEQQLDEVAQGKVTWLPYLREFWDGKRGLLKQLAAGREGIDPRDACTLRGFEDLPCKVRIGRYGPYLEHAESGNGDAPVRATIPDDLPPADLTVEKAKELLQRKVEGPTALTVDPVTKLPVYVKDGRFGAYVQLGEDPADKTAEKPKRSSLPRGMKPEQVTAEIALGLLALPKLLGKHPDSGEPVKAGIGRFGPYVQHGSEFRSLTKDDDVLSVSFARAMELLSADKRTARRASGPAPIKELGAHPTREKPLVVMAGRFGAYVTCDGINATLPKGTTPETLTLEDAVALIEKKAEAGPSTKVRRGRPAARGVKAAPKTAPKTTASATAKPKAAPKAPPKAPAKPKAATPGPKIVRRTAITRQAP